jgi:parallel beta-helix repeat protein
MISSIMALAISLLSPSPVHAALTPHDPIYINGNTGFTKPDPVNGGGSGTKNDPYIIENWDINASSANGIEIRNTTAYFTIRNCYLHLGLGMGFFGIYFDNVINGSVDNDILENNTFGIDLHYSRNNLLSNNILNYGGIVLSSSDNNLLFNNIVENNSVDDIYLDSSNNNVLSNNMVKNSDRGIDLELSSFNLLSNNIVKNNTNEGIFQYAAFNVLSNNIIENNHEGIFLYYASSMVFNNIIENNYYGIFFYLQTSNYSYIYHNNFVNNAIQALDNGTNTWDNGYPSGGNYWSDYTGVDENRGENQDMPGSDGIGDTPYSIAGGSNLDHYPLMRSWSPSIPLTEIRTVIYPTADVYAFGEYGTEYSRTQLKFDISSILPQGRILSAKLWLRRFAADGWDGGVTLNRVDDQLWGENITASEFDSQAITNEETRAGKFTSSGWDYLDATDQLNSDYGAGNTYASFRLRWANDNGSEPSIEIDDGRFLVIDGSSFSLFLYSSEYDDSDPYLEIVYVPPYAVSASISPSEESGQPTQVLSYTVTVSNTGNLDDNYILTASDNMGWGPLVSPTLLTVASGSAVEATLTVTIPENAIGYTEDNITVVATSQADTMVSDNASCTAHVQVVRGVNVIVEPKSQFDVIGENAVFTVTVKNTGDIWDNYYLTPIDDAGWALKLDNGYLEIPGHENSETKLTVSVPDNENLVWTTDNITVVATAVDNAEVTDNDNTTVHAVPPWTGTATFRLENLYAVGLEKDLWLYQGSKLVAMFYTYWGSYQDSTVLENFTPPIHIVENENVSRPEKGAIQRVELVLVDGGGNVLRTIKIFETSRTVLVARIGRINALWPFANDAQRTAYVTELGSINGLWPFSPDV